MLSRSFYAIETLLISDVDTAADDLMAHNGRTDDGRALVELKPGLDTGNVGLMKFPASTDSSAPLVCERYMIVSVETGALTLLYRRSSHSAGKGSLVLTQPGEVLSWHPLGIEGFTGRAISIGPEMMQAIVQEVVGGVAGLPFFPSPVVLDALSDSFLSLHGNIEQGGGTLLEQESLLLATLTALVLRHADRRLVLPPPRREHRAVRQAREYLEDNYAINVSLAELSHVTGLNPIYLNRVFRREVGIPPRVPDLRPHHPRPGPPQRRDAARRGRLRDGLREPEPLHQALQAPGQPHPR